MPGPGTAQYPQAAPQAAQVWVMPEPDKKPLPVFEGVTIGAGAAIGGKAFHGANGFAGELHYLPIKNNLEYAKSHFAGADMVAYYMQVIRAYAALLNPDRVVLYDDPLISGKVERIRNACAQTLPPQALPVIELSREFTQDYEAGLCALALGLVEERL